MCGAMRRCVAGGGVLALALIIGLMSAAPGVADAAGGPAGANAHGRAGTLHRGFDGSTRRLQFILVRGVRSNEGCIEECATLWP